MKGCSRRWFLQMLASGGGARYLLASCSLEGLYSPAELLTPAGPSTSLFKSVPPSTSGITWKHVNGRSASSYPPETMCPWIVTSPSLKELGSGESLA